MGADPWVEMESVIRDQLAMQVELSFHRHHRFMVEHGLARCGRVLDLGTGSGLFLGRLAREHRAVRFHGVDDKPGMIEEASARMEPNIDWLQADARDESVQKLLSRCDGVLMRYFVLHLANTGTAIPQILRDARPGTRLWVFDLDTDHSICQPEEAAYRRFQELVRSFCDKNSVEVRVGTTLPPILAAAGFEVDAVSVEPFSNREVDSGLFAEYLLREAVLYEYFLAGRRSSEVVDQLEDLLLRRTSRSTHFIRYGMAMISAVKRRA